MSDASVNKIMLVAERKPKVGHATSVVRRFHLARLRSDDGIPALPTKRLAPKSS